MIFSSSVTMGCGSLFRTGYIPTDCPRIQSTSKLLTVSNADCRSGTRADNQKDSAGWVGAEAPGRAAKPSNRRDSVSPETYRSGTTVRP